MRKLLIPFFLCALGASAFAQSTQNGRIAEYNGKKDKTPLANVEIKVKNAGSNVSDRKGMFTLSFRTLKPGDKIDVVSITKDGYEIFNKDALESWRVANDGSTFTVVLCKSVRFKALKDQYNAVASKSYAQQKAKDEARLAALLEEGKLKQAEYENQLKALKDRYDEQLENLDNYIDRFARIDLSELSSQEQKIIEMVQAGKIDEAIKAYEDMQLEDRYAQAVQNINVASDAIRQLENVKKQNTRAKEQAYAAVKRMNDARRLQGGEANFDKIQNSLRQLALSDTTSLEIVKEYADYALTQNNYKEAIDFYNICIRGYALDKTMLFRIYNNIGNVYFSERNYEMASDAYLQSYNLLSELVKIDNDKYIGFFAAILLNLSNLYSNLDKFEESIELQQQSIAIYDSLSLKNPKFKIDKVKALTNIADTYRRTSQNTLSEEVFLEAILCYNNEVVDSLKSKEIIATIDYNFGLLYEKWDSAHYDEAEKYYKMAISEFQDLYEKNPERYASMIMNNYSRLSLLFWRQNEIDTSMYWQKMKNDMLEYLYQKNSFGYGEALAQSCMILADYMNWKNDFSEAKIYIMRALEIVPDNPDYLYILGTAFLKENNTQEAKNQWDKIIAIYPDYYNHLKELDAPTDLYDELKAYGYIKD